MITNEQLETFRRGAAWAVSKILYGMPIEELEAHLDQARIHIQNRNKEEKETVND